MVGHLVNSDRSPTETCWIDAVTILPSSLLVKLMPGIIHVTERLIDEQPVTTAWYSIPRPGRQAHTVIA